MPLATRKWIVIYTNSITHPSSQPYLHLLWPDAFYYKCSILAITKSQLHQQSYKHVPTRQVETKRVSTSKKKNFGKQANYRCARKPRIHTHIYVHPLPVTLERHENVSVMYKTVVIICKQITWSNLDSASKVSCNKSVPIQGWLSNFNKLRRLLKR